MRDRYSGSPLAYKCYFPKQKSNTHVLRQLASGVSDFLSVAWGKLTRKQAFLDHKEPFCRLLYRLPHTCS